MIIHQTKRLQLHAWDLADFEAFAALARDPKVMRYIAEGTPWPDSRIGWFLGLQNAYQTTLGYCHWKMVSRPSGALIGTCGLAPLAGFDAPEIGWWLDPSHWGQGYAQEAAVLVLQEAFEKHEFNRVVARSYDTNLRSVSLLGKLGFTLERSLKNNVIGTVDLFVLQRDDWSP